MYNGRVKQAFIRETATLKKQDKDGSAPGFTAVACDSVDIKVLNAKEGYAPSIAPSTFKRHAGLKILIDYGKLIATKMSRIMKHIIHRRIAINNKIIILITRKIFSNPPLKISFGIRTGTNIGISNKRITIQCKIKFFLHNNIDFNYIIKIRIIIIIAKL